MENLENVQGFNQEAKVPDLDWASLDVGDVKNIPSPFHIEIIPQLQEAWSGVQDKSTHLVPNKTATAKKSSYIPETASEDIIDTAKKEIMLGHTGKELADRLSSLYPQDVIQKSSEGLKKVASEQGLLGNVYVDVSPFNSCEEAARILGPRTKTAKYVVGTPKGRSCETHKTGHCRAFNKDVVSEITYGDDLYDHYTSHLKMAGIIASNEKIASKEDLRHCFITVGAKTSNEQKKQANAPSMEITSDMERAFSEQLVMNAKQSREAQPLSRFEEARPVLSFIQNEMLRGKIGNDLMEGIRKKLSTDQIRKFEPEIRKLASLQGLLGNVYVDVSYYKDASEAIEAVKRASTSPMYLVQTVKEKEFDDTLSRVASATGCDILPKDGKIDKKVAYSYIDDLSYNKKIGMNTANSLKTKLASDSQVLGTIREAFLASMSFKPEVRTTGVKASLTQGTSKKAADRFVLREAVNKALDAGIPMDKIEEKVSAYVPTPEAMGLVRDVLSQKEEVNVESLVKCASEKYQLNRTARLKKAAKCNDCILNASSICTQLNARFAGEEQIDKAYFDIDPKTSKVQYQENPDVSRMDMRQEYDMSDNFGSNMTIALDKMQEKDSTVDIDINNDPGSGIDSMFENI